MKQEQDNLISIDSPKSAFEPFLEINNNKRIFFSGKFGIGKTFFLQKFFEERKDKFDTYHLFPIRYQIARNENVVELLKYDILVELLGKYPDACKDVATKGINGWLRLFTAFCKDRGLVNRFLESAVEAGGGLLELSPDPLFQILGKLGRPLKDLLTLDKEFQEFKKEYLSGEKGIVEKFIRKIAVERDSIATDYIGYLLHKRIAELKGQKKSVLVLDDFDRIDPEHIFRILNLLSSHMEGSEDNKFGFDRVIVVGDMLNIRSIFHHRYGAETEFWGYFDKFFTVKPYEFNNQKAIMERMPYLLQRARREDTGLKEAMGDSGIITNLLEDVLSRAFNLRELNLRQLYRPVNYCFPEIQKGAYHNGPFVDIRNQCIDISLKLLIAIYGGKENFLRVLNKIRDNSSSSDTKGGGVYAQNAYSMLLRMMSFSSGSVVSWLKKYPVKKNEDDTICLDQGANAHARFFYDTLVEYVERSKYEKENWLEYR